MFRIWENNWLIWKIILTGFQAKYINSPKSKKNIIKTVKINQKLDIFVYIIVKLIYFMHKYDMCYAIWS